MEALLVQIAVLIVESVGEDMARVILAALVGKHGVAITIDYVRAAQTAADVAEAAKFGPEPGTSPQGKRP